MPTYEADPPLLDVPATVPARMLNEFVFCRRFFHLAWSAGETGENELTVEGKWAHRSVEQSRGTLGDAPGGGGRTRALDLGSRQLGLSARADVVESGGGEVLPVEYKLGEAHDPEHPVWEPERIQLAALGLLLRDAGYACSHGIIYFTGSKQRVRIDFDDALLGEVRRILHDLRTVAADPMPPPPLVDDPRCPTCIMLGACLPDEQNLLRGRRTTPPRRLLPTEHAARPLYVTQPGTTVGRDGERVVVRQGKEVLASVRMIDVSQLAVFGNVQVSTALARELFTREVPISWFSHGGWFFGISEGLPAKNVELRIRQALAAREPQISIARRLVEGKILNARTLLRRNASPTPTPAVAELKRLALRSVAADDAGRLLAVEGAAARLYFSLFSTMFKGGSGWRFSLDGRNRRPPQDPVNALLSFVYSLLIKDLTATVFSVGLDPYIGVFHRPRFGRPALALDLAEEFRPLIADSVVLTLVNNGEIKQSHFTDRGGGVGMTAEGRRKVLAAYERRLDSQLAHPLFKYRVSYRRTMEVQARLLAAVLLEEFEEYRAVVTR